MELSPRDDTYLWFALLINASGHNLSDFSPWSVRHRFSPPSVVEALVSGSLSNKPSDDPRDDAHARWAVRRLVQVGRLEAVALGRGR